MCKEFDIDCNINELYIIPNRDKAEYELKKVTIKTTKCPTTIKEIQKSDMVKHGRNT